MNCESLALHENLSILWCWSSEIFSVSLSQLVRCNQKVISQFEVFGYELHSWTELWINIYFEQTENSLWNWWSYIIESP